MVGRGAESRRLRAGRSAKAAVDPHRPLGTAIEEERLPDGRRVRALTVFLAGAECPFTCVFCDLWRHTLDGPTPPGALPRQLEAALAESAGAGPFGRIKLYNASNFFDRRAVPPGDDAALAGLLAPFPRVTVECHPRLVGERCARFARRLAGRLEVAMGLETVHPEAFRRLNKGMEVADFDRAVRRLAEAGCGSRAFVLVGAPWVPPSEAAGWAVRSAEHALEVGVEHVSLIPLRGGSGEMERLAAAGAVSPPSLGDLEGALDGALAIAAGRGVVTADLWDLERLAACGECFASRRERLARLCLGGEPEPRVACAACAAA